MMAQQEKVTAYRKLFCIIVKTNYMHIVYYSTQSQKVVV